jgi:MFS family permease
VIGGAGKALVADLVSHESRGRALGADHAVIDWATLLAGVIFGFLCPNLGRQTVFGTGAALAMLAAPILPRSIVLVRWERGWFALSLVTGAKIDARVHLEHSHDGGLERLEDLVGRARGIHHFKAVRTG